MESPHNPRKAGVINKNIDKLFVGSSQPRFDQTLEISKIIEKRLNSCETLTFDQCVDDNLDKK